MALTAAAARQEAAAAWTPLSISDLACCVDGTPPEVSGFSEVSILSSDAPAPLVPSPSSAGFRPLFVNPIDPSTFPVFSAAAATFFSCASDTSGGISSFSLANSSIAAFVAAAATCGSTTEAKNATVDITGFPV